MEEILHQFIGFVHSRWCRVSSINRKNWYSSCLLPSANRLQLNLIQGGVTFINHSTYIPPMEELQTELDWCSSSCVMPDFCPLKEKGNPKKGWDTASTLHLPIFSVAFKIRLVDLDDVFGAFRCICDMFLFWWTSTISLMTVQSFFCPPFRSLQETRKHHALDALFADWCLSGKGKTSCLLYCWWILAWPKFLMSRWALSFGDGRTLFRRVFCFFSGVFNRCWRIVWFYWGRFCSNKIPFW